MQNRSPLRKLPGLPRLEDVSLGHHSVLADRLRPRGHTAARAGGDPAVASDRNRRAAASKTSKDRSILGCRMAMEISSTGPMNQPDFPRRSQQDLPAAAPHQDLPLELIRHYTDLLRIMAERVEDAVPHAAAAPAAAMPSEPRVEDTIEGRCSFGGGDLLQSREWTQGCMVALCLQHRLHAVYACGTDGRGDAGRTSAHPGSCGRAHRRMWSALRRSCMPCRPAGLVPSRVFCARYPRAVRRAAVTVWGSGLALQRCLRTKTGAVVALLGQKDARRIRHRLRLAWMLEAARRPKQLCMPWSRTLHM